MLLKLENCRETLVDLDYITELESSQTFAQILKKIPESVLGRWRKTCRLFDAEDKHVTLLELLQAIQDVAEEWADPLYGKKALKKLSMGDTPKPSASSAAKKKENKPARRQASVNTAQIVEKKAEITKHKTFGKERSADPCAHCKGPHPIFVCTDYKDTAPNLRLKLAQKANLCL